MKYLIESKVTGVQFGVFKGQTEDEALDNFAMSVRYRDFNDLLNNVPMSTKDELLIEEVK